MPSQQPTITTTATTAPLTKDLTLHQRQRRSHKKSRRGCASCKHRRIKCDESKPGCKRCRSFGLECTYEGGVSELTFAGEGCFRLDGLDRLNEVEEASRKGLGSEGGLQVSKGSDAGACGFETGRLPSPRTVSQASTIVGHLSGLPSPPTSGSEDGGLKTSRMAELEILARFNERTVLSVGTRQAAKIYQREVFELACMYPFLQHIVITLTLLHDRHLSGASNIDRRILSHCYQGTSQFKEILMKPIAPETKDALWASAALLGAIQIANFEARTPEEAWPLKPHDPADLDWLKMSEGKKAVFAIASPLRPESRFCHISNGHGALFRPMMEKRDCERGDLVGMTRDFSNIFGLGPDSSGAENPYYEAGITLARLLHVQCDGDNIVEFFGFMMHLSPEFKRLLARKDAKALLMFAYWYAKLWKGQWWLHRRGLIEGRAICLFLERFHGDDACLQRMLVWPKRELGLDTMNGDEGGGSKWCLSAATVLCVV